MALLADGEAFFVSWDYRVAESGPVPAFFGKEVSLDVDGIGLLGDGGGDVGISFGQGGATAAGLTDVIETITYTLEER